MFGWKAKATVEEEPEDREPLFEDDSPTWADGTVGPQNPVSRVFGRSRDDAEHEARLAVAD